MYMCYVCECVLYVCVMSVCALCVCVCYVCAHVALHVLVCVCAAVAVCLWRCTMGPCRLLLDTRSTNHIVKRVCVCLWCVCL
jgi:hypothetical protein